MSRPTPSDVDSLLAQLMAEGLLVIPRPPQNERGRLRRLIYATGRSGRVPDGQRLRHRGRDAGDVEIWLEADVVAAKPVPPEVPVPGDLGGAHPIVLATRKARADRDGWVDTRRVAGQVHVRVHRGSLTRALLLVHALVVAASDRGHAVVRHSDRWSDGGLWLEIAGQRIQIHVSEDSHRVDHVPTVAERARGYGYPRWHFEPTGRLNICGQHGGYSVTLANDRRRWTVETRLGHALLRLEAKATELVERELELDRRHAERVRQWERAMVEARRLFAEHRRGEWLQAQAAAHRQATELKEFQAAAAAAADGSGEQTEWLAWMAEHIRRIDPLAEGLRLPPGEEPGLSELARFMPTGMNPWSPPERGR